MYAIDEKIMVQEGKVIEGFKAPAIILESRYAEFPAYQVGQTRHYNGALSFNTSVPNIIYVDYGDGSPILEQSFTTVINLNDSIYTHHYTDGITVHFVRIWFKFPNKITRFTQRLVTTFGSFPEGIVYLNLNNLLIGSITYYSDFVETFPPTYIDFVDLDNMLLSTYVGVPEWILRSRIQTLRLGSDFDLSNPVTNRIDQLINVKDLTNFVILSSNTGITDVASNFKDITTLRRLMLGTGQVPGITPNINACKQIIFLGFGYHSSSIYGTTSGSSTLDTWGVGVAGMDSLEELSVQVAGNLMPTNLPPGMDLCPSLKTLDLRSVYKTQERIDEFIENTYNEVDANASMIVGDTIYRNITLRTQTSAAVTIIGASIRPSGEYQMPNGFVLGSSNGAPSTPMEMIYVLTKQYRWTISVVGVGGTGVQTFNYNS